MPTPEEGKKAPSFNVPASSGKKVALKDFSGKKNVVLYFYPKDNTPGCTVQACGFAKGNKKIEAENAVVLGVSPDGLESHDKFISKFKLPFVLLSDENKKMVEKYGVWVQKNMYGKKYMGVARTTFIIGKDGKVKKIFKKVKPEGHEKEVLQALKELD